MRFVHREPGAVRIELFGETTDWLNPIALGEDGVELALPEGVYQYKFRCTYADGSSRWALDAENARTRSRDGKQNSVVGGADEPYLFAASEPWVVPLEGGGLRLLVGIRRGGVPTLQWSEGDRFEDVALSPVFEEDEHAFFEGLVPASAKAVRFRVGDHETTYRPPRRRLPEWWKRARIYGVFVDRFRPQTDRSDWTTSPPARGAAAGGHLDGIRRSLDELRELGIDTLYLTPVHVAASAHRYDLVDPLAVDPALGGEDGYAALVRDARARGMNVVQDVSFVHVGRGFPAWEDVIANGAASRFAAWFVWRDGALVHYGRRKDAPLLDLEHPEVQALALDAVTRWARRGVRGLRFDMTAELPLALGQRLRRRFLEIVPDGVIFGEVVPQHAWRWQSVVDASTDFGFHRILTALVCDPNASAAQTFAALHESDLLRGGDARTRSVRFLSTHDHVRLATLAVSGGATSRLPLAYAMLLTLPGIPMLLYGEELGLRAADPEHAPEDVWPDRMPMPWGSRDPTLRAVVKQLLALRTGALQDGKTTLLHAEHDVLVYRREGSGDVVDVALNFSAEPQAIELEDDERPAMTALAGEVEGQTMRLPPHGFAIARRSAVARFAGARNLLFRDRDLASGAARAVARPSRFFFSVTERCNLRCAHCITHAPERTRDGTARTMTPAVVDALGRDLEFADYFAFVHGGESLAAPILFDLLERIQGARTEPYAAHLLSNGVKLDPATVDRLVARGVRSISVSLDGATAKTNDAIREGGRFEDVCENVRRLRRPDLRVGLSFVVLAQNLGELEAFVDLALDLGVDWVKLEEGVPATAFARRSLVSCASPGVRTAIDAAVARGRSRGLVMVDHTQVRVVWRCRLDDDTRAFLEADEYANRAVIHPCRSPWENACIEPNGDVRLGDFFGPILGNVTRVPLAELWNADVAREARREATRARLCGGGPVVCVEPPR